MHIMVGGADVTFEGNESELLGILRDLTTNKPTPVNGEVLSAASLQLKQVQQQLERQRAEYLEARMKDTKHKLAKNAAVDLFPKVSDFIQFIERNPEKMLMPMGYFLRMMNSPKPADNNEWSRVYMRLSRARKVIKERRNQTVHST